MNLLRRLWERRRSPRREMALAAEYRLVGGPGEGDGSPWQPARVRDLSEEGLCLLVAGLAPGGRNLVRCLEDAPRHPLEVVIRPPGGESWTILAHLCWVNLAGEGDGGGYRLGLELAPGSRPPADWRRRL